MASSRSRPGLELPGDEKARKPWNLTARKPRADTHALSRVVPLRDRRAEVVQLRERPSLRIRDEKAHVLEPVGEELRDPLPKLLEPLSRARGHLQGTRKRVAQPPPGESVEAIGLVQDELDRDVVAADLGQD